MTHRNRAASFIVAALIFYPAVGCTQTFKVEKWKLGGDTGHDYITAEPGTGRVFVSRGTHVMVVDGATGQIIGHIADTPRVHGVALAPKQKKGFTTNAGDSTVTIFDLKTLLPIEKLRIEAGGLDGIMYDEASHQIVLTNHSTPGTAVTVDAEAGEVSGTATLEDRAPEGAATDGAGRLYVNNESKNTIQVLKLSSMATVANWPIAPCDGPTGIALDRKTGRIFSGCSKTSVVVDVKTGKVVATIANGDGVDALGWDPVEKLIYIPGGRTGDVTVVRQDGPDTYTVVATVKTMVGAKTIAVDPVTHRAYAVALERGPAPAPAPGAAAPAGGRAPQGPIIGAWFFAISH